MSVERDRGITRRSCQTDVSPCERKMFKSSTDTLTQTNANNTKLVQRLSQTWTGECVVRAAKYLYECDRKQMVKSKKRL